MKLILSVVVFVVIATGVYAQELPAPSPHSHVEQVAGLTKITIDYSSPGVKGRKIWGGLEAYDEVWRTGANAATTIEFSKDVTINGKAVKAGKYSLLTIPGQEEWTVILNNDVNASEGSYDPAKDAVRVKVKPQEIPLRERMTFIISDFDNEKAVVNLEWEKVRVPFTVNLHTEEQAMENIENELGNTWRTYANAARHTLREEKNYDKGLTWVSQSIDLKEEWYNHWIKAQLLKETGDMKQAYKHLQKAKELGDQSDWFFYKDEVDKELVEWKAKL